MKQTQLTETGFHDIRGIPIHVGDLIRVKHFKHYRRREQMWLYFHVVKMSGRYYTQRLRDANTDNRQCLLQDCEVHTAEVLDGETGRDSSGGLIMWNERKRRKV